jgi:hypothetical protein
MSSDDIKWISRHSKELAKYEGEYVGIVDGKVVASAQTSGQVLQKVHQIIPNANPIIMLIPPKGLSF